MTYLLEVKPIVGKKFTMTFDTTIQFIQYIADGNYQWIKIRKLL